MTLPTSVALSMLFLWVIVTIERNYSLRGGFRVERESVCDVTDVKIDGLKL